MCQAAGRADVEVRSFDGVDNLRGYLTLSCNHRALDGAGGAPFPGALAELIEEPLALLARRRNLHY